MIRRLWLRLRKAVRLRRLVKWALVSLLVAIGLLLLPVAYVELGCRGRAATQSYQPLITDPDYRWWYGDNHLAECIELAGGRQMRVVGLPIKHVNEGTAQHHDLYAAKLQDRGRFVTRHQRGFGVAP